MNLRSRLCLKCQDVNSWRERVFRLDTKDVNGKRCYSIEYI